MLGISICLERDKVKTRESENDICVNDMMIKLNRIKLCMANSVIAKYVARIEWNTCRNEQRCDIE